MPILLFEILRIDVTGDLAVLFTVYTMLVEGATYCVVYYIECSPKGPRTVLYTIHNACTRRHVYLTEARISTMGHVRYS